MKLANLTFPVFILPKDVHIYHSIDEIVFADGKCLDDLNIKEDTLGKRRLKSSYPNKYPLIKSYNDLVTLIKSSGKRFIDTKGKIFLYEKRNWVALRYFEIFKIENNIESSIVKLYGLKNSFQVYRPPNLGMKWAGVLYNQQKVPWLLYEFAEERKRDTKRKI